MAGIMQSCPVTIADTTDGPAEQASGRFSMAQRGSASVLALLASRSLDCSAWPLVFRESNVTLVA